MTDSFEHFWAVIAEIDACNARDPRQEIVGAGSRPYEVVYSQRMSECLSHLYPDASEELRIAARAQHICRYAAQPRFFFCGHIHEAAGAQQKLGVTSAMNVGKKGYLLDLDNQAEQGFI